MVLSDINEMLRIGVDVEIVTLRPEPEKTFTCQLRLEKDKCHQVVFKSLFDIFSWFSLVRKMRIFGPDLLVTHLWFANTVGRMAGKISGVKKIISFEQNVYDNVKTKKMFFADRFLQGLSTKIIAVSEAVKRSLMRHGIRENNIDVLYNSIDLEPFQNSTAANIRQEYGIPENAFIYICIGRLIHQKAVDVLIDAFAKVVGNSYLLLVGQGKDREMLERRAKERGVGERVIFAGVRSDVSEILAASDCFVLASRYEGLPLVITEALAAGMAIIVSDFEAAFEVIDHNKSGLVVPKEDVGALARAMDEVRNDNELKTRLERGAKVASTRFSVSEHVLAILQYAK